jgi:toxin ParE1/3/4
MTFSGSSPWYLVEQGAPEVAFRFLDAVEAPVGQLLRMPGIGSPNELKNPSLKGLRAWPVKDFDEILIFYVVEKEAVKVIRILHGKRDIARILKRESADDDTVH